MNPDAALIYHLDAEDRIMEVGPGWNEFASENGAPALTREAVIGKSIYDFITGKETIHIYEILLKKVRSQNKTLRFPFRCDSPRQRRYMSMAVRPLVGGAVEFDSQLLHAEPRVPLAVQAPGARAGRGTLKICSWCRRAQVGPEQWVEMEDAVSWLVLFDSVHLPELSHGICDDCLKSIESGFEDSPDKARD